MKARVRLALAASLILTFLSASNIAEAQMLYNPAGPTFTIDQLGRLLGSKDKDPVPCPRQTSRTMVLLIAGQSNAANHAEMSVRTRFDRKVVNYFSGKCYAAASPLLGATGLSGESWTMLGDKLVQSGRADNVIIANTSIGGTRVARWQAGGDLNRLLQDIIANVRRRYRITHVLWHQGETDHGWTHISSEAYASSMRSMIQSIRENGVDAPVFVSVASKGMLDAAAWAAEDRISSAQRQLVNEADGIFAGPDTNALIPPSDRYDGTHFGKAGQEKFSDEWVRLLAASPKGDR